MSGRPARRAIVRWAWRSFRREWRQQALVLGLLALAVATGVAFEALLYNTTGVREQATFGSANHRYEVDDPDPAQLSAALAEAEARFGAVDVVGTWTAPLPGSVDTVDHLAQDPEGTYAEPMLAMVDGRHPAAGEAAITDGLETALGLGLGDRIDLDGRSRTIVGIVENPSDLERDFVLTAPSERDRADVVALLFDGAGGFDEVADIRAFGSAYLPEAGLSSKGDRGNGQAAAAVLGGAQVVLLLVCLVASAGFAAMAHRRVRQLGLLGAVGATDRQVGLVVVTNGAIVGASAAAAGAVVGLGAWLVSAPLIEESVGYRIDPWSVPWPLLGATVLAAVVTATAAAWIPARTAARVPTVRALAGRPSAPVPTGRSVRRGVTLLLAGTVALLVGARSQPLLVAAGTLAAGAGVLSLSPMVTSAFGRTAGRFPVAMRIAFRDLDRHRSRSATALAAVGLALGIPIATVVLTGAAEADETLPNLPADQALVWTKDPRDPDGVSPFYTVDSGDEGFAPYLPDLGPADLRRLGAAVDRAAADADLEVTPLRAVVDPDARDDPEGRRAVTIARPTEIGYLDVALVYEATPALLERYGVAVGGGADGAVGAGILTTGPTGPTEVVLDGGGLWLANTADPPSPIDHVTTLPPSNPSHPGTFATPGEIDARGWSTVTVGWLLSGSADLAPEQVSALREMATAEGLLVEGPDAPRDLGSLRWGATAAGTLVALVVLAMTVGLIRVEAARDLRILVAAGASSAIQRSITAATAGALAIAGALLGTIGTYLIVATGYVDDLDHLLPVPFGPLAAIVVGLPVVAAAAGWLAAARTPSGLGGAATD